MAGAGAGNGGARSPPSGCRGGRGCGLALGRLVRKLRRHSCRVLCAASSAGAGARHAGANAASRCHQYDALSYARNFDFGTALDDGSEGYCSFASRFVLAAPPPPRQQQDSRG